jgi:protein TonB
MFEQMLLPTGGTHLGRNTVIAFAGQLGVVAMVTLAMAYFDVLPLPFPRPIVPLVLSVPPPPALNRQAAATRAPVQTARVIVPRVFHIPTPTAPVTIPQHAAIIAEAPPALPDLTGAGEPGGVAGGVPGGIPGGSLNGVVGALAPPPVVAIAPKPAAPAVPEAPTQIRVGGDVEAARLTHEVMPVYPSIARNARVQGIVRLSASIAPNGSVKDLRVLSGNPLLAGAAKDAVKQWTYKPTYLNGKPTEVLTEIDVKFSLG